MHVMSGFSVADLIESTMVKSRNKKIKERETVTLNRSETENLKVDRDACSHRNKNQTDIPANAGKRNCDFSMSASNANAFNFDHSIAKSVESPSEVPERQMHFQCTREIQSSPVQDLSSKAVLNVLHEDRQNPALGPFSIFHSSNTLAYFATLLDLPGTHSAEANTVALDPQFHRKWRAPLANDTSTASLLPLIQWDQFMANPHRLQTMTRTRESNGSFCSSTGGCPPSLQHQQSPGAGHIYCGNANRPSRSGLHCDEALENRTFLPTSRYEKITSLNDFNQQKVNNQIWWHSRLSESMRPVSDFMSPSDEDINYHIPTQQYRSGKFEIADQSASGTLTYLSDGRKPKRIRTAFSPSQLFQLEGKFERNHYVVGHERKELASELGLSETQVKVWFQNRRTKYKRLRLEEKGLSGATKVSSRPVAGSTSGSPEDHPLASEAIEVTYAENGVGLDEDGSLRSSPAASVSATTTGMKVVNSTSARSPRKFEPFLGVDLQPNAHKAAGNPLYQDEGECNRRAIANDITVHSGMPPTFTSQSEHRFEKTLRNMCPHSEKDCSETLNSAKG